MKIFAGTRSSGEANQEAMVLPRGVWGRRPQKNRVEPRLSEPRKRGKRPSGYVEIKITVKHFSLPHFGKKGMKVRMLSRSSCLTLKKSKEHHKNSSKISNI